MQQSIDKIRYLQLTSCHFKSQEYRNVFGRLFGTKYERKCPDLLIDDDLFYEYEGFEKPWKKEKVRRMISHGMKQSALMIINNTHGASDRFIRQAIVARLNVGASIKEFTDQLLTGRGWLHISWNPFAPAISSGSITTVNVSDWAQLPEHHPQGYHVRSRRRGQARLNHALQGGIRRIKLRSLRKKAIYLSSF